MLVILPITDLRADAFTEAAGRYLIAPDSHITFSVGQVGGGGISGTFTEFSGSFVLDGSDLSRSSVDITLFPGSIRTGEPRVESFLRSDAVFDVARSPQITFRSTQVVLTGPTTARIDGVLTARGKTHGESFQAELRSRDARHIVLHVEGGVYRSPYGMDVGTPIYSNVVAFDMLIDGQRQ